MRQFSYWLAFYFYLTLMLTGFLAPLVSKLKVKSFFVKHSSNKQRRPEWRKFIRSNWFRKRIKLVLLSCYTALFLSLTDSVLVSLSCYLKSRSTLEFKQYTLRKRRRLRTNLSDISRIFSFFTYIILSTGSRSIYLTFILIKVGITLRRKTNRRTSIGGKEKLALHLCLVSSSFKLWCIFFVLKLFSFS